MSGLGGLRAELELGALPYAPPGTVVGVLREPGRGSTRVRLSCREWSVTVEIQDFVLAASAAPHLVRLEMERAARQLAALVERRERDPWAAARAKALEYLERSKWRDATVPFEMVV